MKYWILIASRDPTSPSANQVPEALDLDKLCACKVGWIAVVLFCGFAFVMCFVVAVSRLLVGAEIHSNRDPNQPKIDPKSTKSGPGGTPKRWKNVKIKKRGVVPNSPAPFWTIFEKNGVQDGPQKSIKINKKQHKKSMKFWMTFVSDF